MRYSPATGEEDDPGGKDLPMFSRMPDQGKGEEKRLPSGEVLDEAYFIFDGSEDLMNARLWAKVQRPYVGRIGAKGMETTFEDVRDVTMIITVEKQ